MCFDKYKKIHTTDSVFTTVKNTALFSAKQVFDGETRKLPLFWAVCSKNFVKRGVQEQKMENSCLKKYKPSPKKWIFASRRTGLRRNSALIPANAGLFHYAGNNPVRYIDPDVRFEVDKKSRYEFKQHCLEARYNRNYLQRY